MSQSLNKQKTSRKNILSRRAPERLIGRERELNEILRYAQSGETNGLLVLSGPADGATELLRQAYDRLFFAQCDTIPFYFALNRNDKTVERAANRFLHSFILQVVAFRRNDPALLNSSPEICEIAELAVPEDGYWVDRILQACEAPSLLADERAFVRLALSAPQRAAAHGAKNVVIIDDLHHAESLQGTTSFITELNEIFSNSSIPFVLAGRRRYLLPATQEGDAKLTETSIVKLSRLSEDNAGQLIQDLASQNDVLINDQTSDLLVQQFDANPGLLNMLFESAHEKSVDLDSFQKCQELYADELLGGRISRYFASLFDEISPTKETQRELISALRDSLQNEMHATQIEFWRKNINSDDESFQHAMRGMHVQEFIRLNSSVVELNDEMSIARDYVEARYRLEVRAEARSLVKAETLSALLKRAPQIMARYYRRGAAIGLRDLLSTFKCQRVPTVLFDYGAFRDKYKGADDEEILAGLDGEESFISLPQIVYTASGASIYPPIKQVVEEERCSVAFGFENGRYSDDNQVVWIVAEVDSKLEASRETTEFWCDRLEMVTLMCNFESYKLWLITPEGFDAEATNILNERGAFGSSKKQVAILEQIINTEANRAKTKTTSNEYEMIVPMGDDTELIAAHTVEEIARRANFKPSQINQIKTALVEACINAAEHSLSPDKKIYQKFSINDGKLIISVSNRGVALPAKAQASANEDLGDGRRGWGLKLIRALMDEVHFEQVDDGTKITMIKYLEKPA